MCAELKGSLLRKATSTNFQREDSGKVKESLMKVKKKSEKKIERKKLRKEGWMDGWMEEERTGNY